MEMSNEKNAIEPMKVRTASDLLGISIADVETLANAELVAWINRGDTPRAAKDGKSVSRADILRILGSANAKELVKEAQKRLSGESEQNGGTVEGENAQNAPMAVFEEILKELRMIRGILCTRMPKKAVQANLPGIGEA